MTVDSAKMYIRPIFVLLPRTYHHPRRRDPDAGLADRKQLKRHEVHHSIVLLDEILASVLMCTRKTEIGRTEVGMVPKSTNLIHHAKVV